MFRKALFIALVVLLLPALLSAYTVVLKDGRHIEAQGRYVVEGNQIKFVGQDGRAYQFPVAEVDIPATHRANRPKLWLNEDIDRLRGGGSVNVLGTASASEATSAATEEAAPEEAAAPAEERKSLPPKEDTAEYWQEQLKPLRDELAKVEAQLQSLRQGQGKAASNQISLTTDAAGAEVQDTIRRLEQRRTELQLKIEDVQREAKRKGVPPGAVR